MQNTNTVAELAIAIPRSIPVLEKLHIDYCCRGTQPIDQACRRAGITAHELLSLINSEPAAAAEARSWDKTSLTTMIQFIIDTHHAYTRQTLQTLQGLAAKVRDRHGEHHPELIPLARLVGELMADLIPHMMKEEQIVFPYVSELESGDDVPPPFFGTVRNPIRMLMMEHEAAGEKVAEIRSVTSNFELPADACTSFTAFYNLLQELERDLHSHIHLENNVLFPRAAALEESALKVTV
jgi:regulator of cell morphogenesis and NO signaling